MKVSVAKIEAFASHDPEALVKMQCVYLDCESQRLLATDGHIAARVSVSIDDDDVTGLLPREVFDLARKELKAIRKALDKEEIPDSWLRIACGQDAVVIENLLSKTNHIVPRPKLSEGDAYPHVDAVFPTKVGAPTITVSRDFLGSILPALDGDGAVSIWIEARDKAVMIAPSSGEAVAVLMPMRDEGDGEKVIERGARK